MKVSDFDYELPEELIAQTPILKRDESRLMVLNRENKTIENKIFKDILDYLKPGDVLVRNNTKVLPARIYGKKDTGANVEFLLLKNIENDIWETIVRPGNKLFLGLLLLFILSKICFIFKIVLMSKLKSELDLSVFSVFEEVLLEELRILFKSIFFSFIISWNLPITLEKSSSIKPP